MSTAPPHTVTLSTHFAQALPEMALPWQAADTPTPTLLLLNTALATSLGLPPLDTPEGLALLTGTHLPEAATPVAQAYAGHQFGNYSPRLGDGRALLLGELTDHNGRLQDLHLKGSGRTPFSRGGDGYAALGPMLREYLLSEAMHALGIPTTRSLAVTTTGRPVHRETTLPGAILARTASSHLRVGSFQFARATNDPDLLRRLADHAIARHHPEATTAENPYLALFDSVVAAQATLISQWMLVGFIHGVMNTDNMTISGETIDYGPCAFLDAYDPTTVYSSIDHAGRYAYGNQPGIAQWNLARLAEALLPLFDDNEDRAVAKALDVLSTFKPRYEEAWTSGMTAKLGLNTTPDTLVDDLLTLLRDNHVDHTSFYRHLATAARGNPEPARSQFLDLASIDTWITRWRAEHPDPDAMDRVNPVYVPRNHLVEEALAAATDGDLTPLHALLKAVTSPYTELPGHDRYAAPAPEDFGAAYQTFCGT
ncbi:YdiU family protein [Umezawaea sp. NPDC059074]|uniref:protein adenylyltransferase SelO n=1 Tax=Umezawaea sp. NPDC059074 TaxID=3346716 RepID=UPI00367F1757